MSAIQAMLDAEGVVHVFEPDGSDGQAWRVDSLDPARPLRVEARLGDPVRLGEAVKIAQLMVPTPRSAQ